MKYYKTDSRRISFVEYWHVSPRGFWLAWWHKILGNQMNLARGIPEPQPFATRIIAAADILNAILDRLNSAIEELRRLGFDQFWFLAAKDSLMTGMAYSVAALHSARQIVAKAIYAAVGKRVSFVYAFFSEFDDETMLGTTNKKRDFNPMPGHIVQRAVDLGPPGLLELHQRRLSQISVERRSLKFGGVDDVAAFDDRLLRRSFEYKINRGIWVEMTEQEVAVLRTQKAVAFAVPPS